MSFQIRDFTSITASMINHLRAVQREVTDFNVGAVGRTILEAVGQEVDQFYQDAFNAVRDAIPVATYRSFNFDKLPEAPAAGIITVTVSASSQDVVLAAGDVFSPIAGGLGYVVQESQTIAAGETTAQVTVAANQVGTFGNLPAGTQFAATPAINNFVSASNAIAFDGGRDLETDDEQKQRFTAYISTLPRAIEAALIYGAKTAALYNTAGLEIERAKCVSVIEPFLEDEDSPISLVEVYVHNGEGTTSGALVAEVDKVLRGYADANGVKVPGWKAAGIKLVTAAATEVSVNLTGQITLNPGFEAADAVAAAEHVLQRHLLELDIGEASLYKDRVVLVANLPAVANIVFTVGTADITCTKRQKLVPGTFTLTAS